MTRTIAIWTLATLLLVAPPIRALEDPKQPLDPGSAPPGALLHGQLALALGDAVAMGVENNLNVEVERHEPYIAEQRASGAWGAYDPELFAEYTHSEVEDPNTNPLLSEDGVLAPIVDNDILNTDTDSWTSGIRGQIPRWGASYQLSYDGTRTTISSDFPTLSPEYRSSLEFSATVPLLRDFLWSEPWFQVRSTRLLSEEAYQNFRRALMDTIQTIETAYWELVASMEQLRVAEKSVETAEALLEQTQAQYEVGVVSRVEVVEAEAGVAQFEFERVDAENRYRRAQDALIDVVLGRNLQPASRLEIQPTDAPEPLAYDVNPDKAAALAFELRPELTLQRREIERLEIQTKFTRNQKLPRLDVVGSYGYRGLAGNANGGRVRGDVPRTYSGTDNDFFTNDVADSWSVGAQFSFPIGNRTAASNANVAKLELRRARTRLLRVEQDVILEVRDAVRNLRSAQDGIEAAEARRLATAEQLRAERIRLENGESTPFDVLQREERFFAAESQKIFALQVYRDSLAALDRAQGTILRTRNVVVDQALALR